MPITLASAKLDITRTKILATIGGSPTAPLTHSGGAVTGFTATAQGLSLAIGAPVITGNSFVLTIPITGGAPKPGNRINLTATSSNLVDSTGTPKTLSNGAVLVQDYQSPEAASLAASIAADPTVLRLQSGDFGKIVHSGGSTWTVYDHDSATVICKVQAMQNIDGTLVFGKVISVP